MGYQGVSRNCKVCARVLDVKPKGRPRETCSDACRQALFRQQHPREASVAAARIEIPMRACGYCKTPFPAVNPKKRFCSDKCRVGHWLKTHRKCEQCNMRFPVSQR